jgi:hypothetical protein
VPDTALQLGGLIERAATPEHDADGEAAQVCSTSQPEGEYSNQRPMSGERKYQLTVAQRAKEAANAGLTCSERVPLHLLL